MQLNEKIKQRRLELGLTTNEAAKKSGLSIHEYADVEDYPDEMTSVLQLSDVRNICKALNIDFQELFKNEATYVQGELDDEMAMLSLNELVRNKRESANITREELGERLDFYEQAIVDIESDPKFLNGWSFELVAKLCAELKIPTPVIFDKLWPYGG
jgi:DNA-binding XRE family transcriptional regulator